MNNQLRKNQITIIVIFALAIVPFLIAWYFAKNPEMLKLGTNNGELIQPPLTTNLSDFKGYDTFSVDNLKEMPGHWVLINILPDNKCTEICQDALHKTKQISLMMNKDISRIRHAALVLNVTEDMQHDIAWPEDEFMLKILPNREQQEKIKQLLGQSTTEGLLIIMDPLGNLMMKYTQAYDPYKVRNDLSKLLKISQIG